MTFPYDEDFRDEDSGIFDDERPTSVEGRRRRREERAKLAKDPNYQMGKLVAEVVRLRIEVDSLKGYRQHLPSPMPTPRHSIKPQVTTAGISAGAAAIVIAIFEALKLIGIIK